MVRRTQRTMSWLVFLGGVLSVTLALQPTMGNAADDVDLAYVTPQAFAAAIVHPQRMLTAPEFAMMPIEIMSAAGKKEFGVDPLDIAAALAFVEPPIAGPPGFGFVIQFSKAYQLDGLTFPANLPLEPATLDGKPYRHARVEFLPSFYMPDDRTLIIAPDAVLKRMLAQHKTPQPGPLVQLLTKTSTDADALAVIRLEPVRPMLNAQLGQLPLPPQFAEVRQLPNLIDAAKIDLSLTGQPQASFVVLAPDEAKATQLEKLINQMLDLGRQMAVANINAEMGGNDPVEQATAQYAKRMLEHFIAMVRPQREGRKLKVAQQGDVAGQTATVGVLVALLLPAVQSAREAARRMQSMNNLKFIALAMHNYHDVHKTFPPRANFSADSKPLLSWRVHLLPFLEQQALYKQFHLDEPWDSPHNKTLIDKMPDVYRNPSSPAAPNLASYLVPAGTGAIFGGTKGTSMRQIRDGTSNTIMVVEVNSERSVPWTKPDDLTFNPQRPLVGLGRAHPGGFCVSMADGSVRFVSQNIDPRVFLQMLNMADGGPR